MRCRMVRLPVHQADNQAVKPSGHHVLRLDRTVGLSQTYNVPTVSLLALTMA